MSGMDALQFIWLVVALTTSYTASVKVVPFQFPQTPVVGDTIRVACYTSAVSTSLTFKWKKDGLPLESRSTVLLKRLEDISTLLLGPVTVEDSGNYTCEASTMQSRDSYTAQLQVYAPPSWIKHPHDYTAVEGTNVTVPCSVTGHPIPTVTWQRDAGKDVRSMP
ncbi:leucine-rich repeats and immunoglobulin-like domains protein 1 [Ornithodoros turicata]|uniref:leucine-rich repeats and immunoglobulin-like domains protein 1 n=1 Tax=Ornithodoros turicata TaxID=34597 RepID=UPI003138D6B1